MTMLIIIVLIDCTGTLNTQRPSGPVLQISHLLWCCPDGSESPAKFPLQSSTSWGSVLSGSLQLSLTNVISQILLIQLKELERHSSAETLEGRLEKHILFERMIFKKNHIIFLEPDS